MPLRSSGSRYWPAPGWSSGIFASWGGAGLPGARGSVGVHSTNFSPISDCGRIRQEASVRKSWKAGSSIRITTIALPGSGDPSSVTGSSAVAMSTAVTEPTFAPATRTSSPVTRKLALSNTARTS